MGHFRTITQHTYLTQTRQTALNFFTPSQQAEAMVTSRAKAAPEEAPTAISTSSTTLPIVLEAADAPASMVEHRMVGERAGTARKAQPREPAVGTCPVGWWVRTQRCGAGACAPYWSSAMPASSRPAILSLRAACVGACETRGVENERCVGAAEPHTCDDDET